MKLGDLRTIVVISDTQIPYHHPDNLRKVLRFISDYQPDEVVQIGDLMDYPQPSQWSKGSAAEYEGSVFADSIKAQKIFFGPLRELYAGPIGVIEGNHDLRPRKYLAKYAPALAESGAFTMPNLLDFQRFGITHLPDRYEFAEGWSMVHGHKDKIRLTQVAGMTALGAAKKFGRSVIMGHTHRLGKAHHTYGYGGGVSKILTGVEVGNLMDMRQASYLDGSGNWQSGFAIVYVHNNKVMDVATIPIVGGKFVVEGHLYTGKE